MTEPEFTVHDQPGFQRVYDEDDEITIRKGDLRALLDIATGSLDFGSGFLDNEQVEVLRKMAPLLGVDPLTVTPHNFLRTYYCTPNGHRWKRSHLAYDPVTPRAYWDCEVCGTYSTEWPGPPDPHAERT